MKQRLRTTVLLSLMVLTLIVPAITVTANLNASNKFQGKISRFEVPMDKPSTVPSAAKKVKTQFVFPEDGVTIPQGLHRVLISASSKSEITNVQLEITGVGAVTLTSIIENIDGLYYYYDWLVEENGAATLTATVTDATGKTATEISQVTIGEPQANKWAVVIGIADYIGRANDLWHPDEDAKDMVSVLETNGYPGDNIKLLLNRKATATNIVSAINWLVANEKAGDEVVFFYSGHGARFEDGENWDLDTESSDGFDELIVTYDSYGLPDGYLKELFSSIESTKFALMFGSCHSGGMFDDENDLQDEGRIIASACKADQYGWDILTLGNTLWGYYFVNQGLLQNNAISIETAHNYAYPYVTAYDPDSEPQLYDGIEGDFTL